MVPSQSILVSSISPAPSFSEHLVGMGRIVGDGAVICYIQDLIVIPEYQHKGVGSLVIKALIKYVESLQETGSQMMLCLMCAKGRESFYEKHGFIARPTSNLGPGMIQYLECLHRTVFVLFPTTSSH